MAPLLADAARGGQRGVFHSITFGSGFNLKSSPARGRWREASEGEETEQRFSLTSPSVWQEPDTSPWRGRAAEGPMRLVQTAAGTSVTLIVMVFVSPAATSNTPGLAR